MKRIFGILAPVIFFIATITTALCSDVTYKIPELFMSISIPDGYTVFTRDIGADDPNLAEFGLDAKSLADMYEQKNIFLNAVNKDVSEELIVTMVTNKDIKKAFNLKKASKNDIKEFLDNSKKAFSAIGATLEQTSEYKHKQALFEVFDFSVSADGTSTSSRMYSTIINGQFINFTFNSYLGSLTDSQKSMLEQIVNSAVFEEQSDFDWQRVFLYAGLAVFLGGVFGAIRYFKTKRKRQKADENPPKQPRPPYAR